MATPKFWLYPLKPPALKSASAPPKNGIMASTEGRKHSPQPAAVGLYGLGLHAFPLGCCSALGGSAIAPPWAAAFPWAASLPWVACIAGSGRSSSRIGFYIRRCEHRHTRSTNTRRY